MDIKRYNQATFKCQCEANERCWNWIWRLFFYFYFFFPPGWKRTVLQAGLELRQMTRQNSALA